MERSNGGVNTAYAAVCLSVLIWILFEPVFDIALA